jgi:putative ABC transport system permease protein
LAIFRREFSMIDHLRYAWRRARGTPVVSLVAVLTMTLGIGAATAVFSVANAVMFRPLPYANPDRLVMIWNRWTGWPATWLSPPEFLDYRDQARSLSDLGAWFDDTRNLTGGDVPERVHIGVVSAGIFPTLGVAPVLGRVFTVDEDHRGGPRVAVISERLWRRKYNADPTVLGRQILLDDSSTTVVGVMPASFQLPLDFVGDPIDVWVPLALGNVDRTDRGSHYLTLVGRLRRGVTVDAADREVQGMAQQMIVDYPRSYSPQFGAFTRTVTNQVIGDIRPTLVVLTAAVGFILLIACANVANILLARAHARQREIAVRASLGASTRDLMVQLLTESGLVAAVSGGAGTLLALVSTHLVASDMPRNVPRIATVGVDGHVLLFAVAVTVVTGLVCGLAPAWHATRLDLHAALKEASTGGSPVDAGGERVRRAVIAGEVALSVVLLVGAGLLVHSFARLEQVDPGFDPGSVLTAHVSLPVAKYSTNVAVRAFYRDVVEGARALPGVTDAAVVRVLPMTRIMGDWSFRIEGRSAPMGQDNAAGDWQVVSPSYFQVMHIPVLAGRALQETDDERGADAVVVNEALAQRAWPDGSPVGQRIRMGGLDSSWRTVVGVVADVHHRGLDAEPRPELYLPHAQWTNGGGAIRDMYIVVRTGTDPLLVAGALRRVVRSLDADLPVSDVRPMREVLSEASATRRMSLIVLAIIAIAASAISAVGLYGVIGFAVAQRTRDIGIRRALGAGTGNIIGVVARQGGPATASGVVIGLVGGLLLARLMTALLFEVQPADPATFLAVVLFVSLVAVAATYVPAQRAARIDPITAVRD